MPKFQNRMNQIQLNRNGFSMMVNSNAPAFDGRVVDLLALAPNDYKAIRVFQVLDNRMFPNKMKGKAKKKKYRTELIVKLIHSHSLVK